MLRDQAGVRRFNLPNMPLQSADQQCSNANSNIRKDWLHLKTKEEAKNEQKQKETNNETWPELRMTLLFGRLLLISRHGLEALN